MEPSLNILIVAGNVRSLVANRGDLIRSWAESGHQVKALVPEYDWNPTINSLPVEWATVPLLRIGTNPLADIRALVAIRREMQNWSPDAVFSYNAKPLIYGSFAAASLKVPGIFSMITGLGYFHEPNGFRFKLAQFAQRGLYRLATSLNTAVFFQNPDDEAMVLRAGMISKRVTRIRTNGSGVNLDRFRSYVAPTIDPPRFLMVARLVRAKGIAEFVSAAKEVRSSGRAAEFALVGGLDKNLPGALDDKFLDEIRRENLVQLVGEVADVRPMIENSSVLVLPSYAEGTPRSVLEAMSMGRPIITTDAPGCRETVRNGRNGFLVPPRSSSDIAQAMIAFIENPDLILKMGRESRAIAEEHFDVKTVNSLISTAMGISTKHV